MQFLKRFEKVVRNGVFALFKITLGIPAAGLPA